MLQVQSIEIMFSPSLPELAREEKKNNNKTKKNSYRIPLKRHCYIIRSLNKTLMKMIEETITVLSLAG